MKTKKKYLPLYRKWLKKGMIDPIGVYHDGTVNYNGMCGLFVNDFTFDLLIPTDDDIQELMGEGKCVAWWGSGMSSRESCSFEGWSSFTPLRQNIILLCAALNGEL